jgi:glyoxylase-like metal-dependent hydrolase (beta-lactamase superfamily II)
MKTLMSRRAFTAAGTLALLSVKPKRRAAQVADLRPPTVDGVWVVRDHRIWLVPNIGIIVGKDAALVVDCGLGPANGEKVLDLARRLAGPRRLMLTLTHFHPEHGYGAQVFRPDATILYNRVQRDEVAEKGACYIDIFRNTQSAAATAALEGTTIVMPHVVHDGPRTGGDLGGRIVELHSVGPAYTRGDQIVFLPKERILFAGDLVEERMFPIFPWFPPEDTDLDGTRWTQVLNDFQRFNPGLIVPVHGDLGTIEIALNLTSHIDSVSRRVRALRQAGKSADEILRVAEPSRPIPGGASEPY